MWPVVINQHSSKNPVFCLLNDLGAANELLEMTEVAMRSLQMNVDSAVPDYWNLLEEFEKNLNPDKPEQSGDRKSVV